MREQDIRRIIKEVCEALDHHRAKAAPYAMGAMLAVAAGCDHQAAPPTGLYMGPPVSESDSTSASSDAATPTATETTAPPADTGAMQVPMATKYGAPYPTDLAPKPPATHDGPMMTPKYMAVFDAGPVEKYGVYRPPSDSSPSM